MILNKKINSRPSIGKLLRLQKLFYYLNFIVLPIFLAVFVYFMIIKIVPKIYDLDKDKEELVNLNKIKFNLISTEQLLEKELHWIQKDPSYIESIARSRFYMRKKGEKILPYNEKNGISN